MSNMGTQNTQNKQKTNSKMVDKYPTLLIRKCKWSKYYNEKAEIVRLDKTARPTLCCP